MSSTALMGDAVIILALDSVIDNTPSAPMSCIIIRRQHPAKAAQKWVDQRVRRGRG